MRSMIRLMGVIFSLGTIALAQTDRGHDHRYLHRPRAVLSFLKPG